MRTLKSELRSKMPKFFLLAMLCIILSPKKNYAQSASSNKPSIAWLSNVDSVNIPLKKIIDNPKLITTVPGCEVTGFTISFLPKGGEFRGPYKTTGAALRENDVNFLKEFTATNVRIFIEDIHLNCDGKDRTSQSLIYKTFP